MIRLIVAALAVSILLLPIASEQTASAMPIPQVVDIIKASGGHYQWAAAGLPAADCSGLVSVAQTLAMGEDPHRLGDTRSMLAGNWPNAIPGAGPGDVFVVGVNPVHMVAEIGGVNIEARQRGEGFRVGGDAASPFSPQFTLYHIDPAVLSL